MASWRPATALLGVLLLAGCGDLSYDGIPTARAPEPPANANAFAGGQTYRVMSGDTVDRVARQFGVPVEALIQANGLVMPYELQAGRLLVIPGSQAAGGPGGVYVVAHGDNLYRIARHHGTTVTALAQLNGLAPPYRLLAGQALRLPGGPPPVQTASAAPDYVAMPPSPPPAPPSATPYAPSPYSPPPYKSSPYASSYSSSPSASAPYAPAPPSSAPYTPPPYTPSPPAPSAGGSKVTTEMLPPPPGMTAARAPTPSAPPPGANTGSLPPLAPGPAPSSTPFTSAKLPPPGPPPSPPAPAPQVSAAAASAPAVSAAPLKPPALAPTPPAPPAPAPAPATPSSAVTSAPAPAAALPSADSPPLPASSERAIASAAIAPPAGQTDLPTPPPRSSGKFLWPVNGKVISQFGPKDGGLHNDGINIAAPLGTPVRAAESGVVYYAGNELRGFGNLLLIRHGGNWITAYAHCDALLVKRGDSVKRGQVIARVGQTGSVSAPQLHFELRKAGQAVDPLNELGAPGA